MARTVRNHKIDSRSARLKLNRRREPHWTKISKGCFVGYRKGSSGGMWIARFRDDASKQHYRSLGAADDAMDAEGVAVLSFDQAQERSREWFKDAAREAAGGAASDGPYAVKDAIHDYLAWFETTGFKSVREKRYLIDAHILPALGQVEVARLTARRLLKWRESVAASAPRLRTRRGEPQRFRDTTEDPEAQRRRKVTSNRALATLKAALNHAWREGKVTSDLGWRSVTSYKGVEVPRLRYLTYDECTRVVNACEADFRPIVRGALYSGCRYGELTRLDVSDFNPDSGTLLIRQSKAGNPRHVVLSEQGQGFFSRLTVGRQGVAPMLVRDDGRRWGRSHQARPLKRACERGRINPPVSFHALRHTYASLLVMNGAPLPVVAQNLGHTDTRMVERHYAHLAPGYVAQEIRAAAPDFQFDDAANIEPLKPRGSASETRQRRAR